MSVDEILKYIVAPLVGSGGFIATLVVLWFNRKKTKAETNVTHIEGAAQTVKTSMMMEELAVERYMQEVRSHADTMSKISCLERMLSEVKEEMKKREEYIVILEKTLIKNGIEIPPRPFGGVDRRKS